MRTAISAATPSQRVTICLVFMVTHPTARPGSPLRLLMRLLEPDHCRTFLLPPSPVIPDHLTDDVFGCHCWIVLRADSFGVGHGAAPRGACLRDRGVVVL